MRIAQLQTLMALRKMIKNCANVSHKIISFLMASDFGKEENTLK